MNKYVKYPLVLGLVALISGALLSGTYHLTKDKIEQGRIDRQTSAINDMFTNITRKELLEVPSEFANKGIETIVEVESNSKIYKCYTVSYKDSADGDPITVIIALNDKGKVHGVKFVSVDSYIKSNYNNEEYLATVVTKDKFDAISNATVTANDLNDALKLVKNCFTGVVKEPIDEMFTSISKKEELTKPSSIDKSINKIYKVTSLGNTYYVFDTTFKDRIGKDAINALYALNNDGSVFKVKIIEGDSYAKMYDGSTNLDIVANATKTGEDLKTQLTVIQNALEEVK